jgi:hypothetical protein
MQFRTSNCVALSTADMLAARDHYVKVLGFEVAQQTEQWVELKTGELRLFLCEDDSPVQPTFDLQVPSLEPALRHLIENGWTQVDLVPNEVFVRDPFGFLYALTPKND